MSTHTTFVVAWIPSEVNPHLPLSKKRGEYKAQDVEIPDTEKMPQLYAARTLGIEYRSIVLFIPKDDVDTLDAVVASRNVSSQKSSRQLTPA